MRNEILRLRGRFQRESAPVSLSASNNSSSSTDARSPPILRGPRSCESSSAPPKANPRIPQGLGSLRGVNRELRSTPDSRPGLYYFAPSGLGWGWVRRVVRDKFGDRRDVPSAYALASCASSAAARTRTFTSTRDPSRLRIAISRSTVKRPRSALRMRQGDSD